uniref:Hamartin n=1 Tax=Clastoptera arizonana TaxID=38151 RepID=A0A1B6CYZ0_9HEMI
MEVIDSFNLLESNQLQLVEDIKKKFHEYFNSTKESWLLNGLFEYYLSTGSLRTVDIFVGVREPHDKYLFDKLSENIRLGPTKLQALTLLGHIVRRQPTWLYKITNHSIFKELLKLLRMETDILPLMSALLIVVVLLPMIAGLLEPHLQEIFIVFSHLAAWNTNNLNKVPEGQLIHLQMGLYALFHRLYGMFPCNFLSYLRHEYKDCSKLLIFSHTIKPMLETVKMHPLLVTASKDAETSSMRWKKMEPHDVIVECAKFAVDSTEKFTDENFKLETFSNSYLEYERSLNNICKSIEGQIYTEELNEEKEMFSPSIYCGISTPPESAPTSIPHTPIAQTYVISSSFPHQEGTSPPEAAVEATPETTPIKMTLENQTSVDSKLGGVLKSRSSNIQPASPLKLVPNSAYSWDSPVNNNSLLLSDGLGEGSTQEDKEVEIMMRSQENTTQLSSLLVSRQCDSVLQEIPSRIDQDPEDEYEECQLELGSPCLSGGLHMPNSKSMMDFARQIKSRHRYYSQCQSGLSSGSSPSENSGFLVDTKVRRANSCPEIKKTLSSSTLVLDKPLVEKEEDDGEQPTINGLSGNTSLLKKEKETISVHTQTEIMLPYEHLFLGVFPALDQQNIISTNNSVENQVSLQNNDVNSSSPLFLQKSIAYSPYQAIEAFINITIQSNNHFKKNKIQVENELKTCKEQLQLLSLQLQFEKHRREMHSERNRRLLGKSRNIRALEEHNSALRDQVSLLQNDKETILSELEKYKSDSNSYAQKLQDIISTTQHQNNGLRRECKELKNRCELLEHELKQEGEKTASITKEWNITKAALFDTCKELQQASNIASVGQELKGELQTIQRELTLAGELQQKYQEKIKELSTSSQLNVEETIARDSFNNQIAAINQTLETRTCNWESAKSRISDLENMLTKKDNIITDLKRKLKATKDEYQEQLEAVESKYTSLRSINCKLEEQILESYHRTDSSKLQSTTHNSSLSTSLSSSGTLSGAESAPIRNLQLLVDTADSINDQKASPEVNNQD